MLGPVKKVKVTSKISNEKDPNIDFLAEFSKVSAEFKSYKSKKLILEIEMEFNNKNIKISKDRSKDFKLNIGASMLDVYDNLYKFIFNKEKISCSAKDALQTLSVVDKVVNSI